jgi:hypothetical protein
MAEVLSFRPWCFASPPFGGFAISSNQINSIVVVSGVFSRHTLQYPNKFHSPLAIPLVSYMALALITNELSCSLC